MRGAGIRVHIVREYPESAGFDDRLFMVLRQILCTERAHAVLTDFLYDILVSVIRPTARVVQIDE